jgi:hypothetical protein
MEDADELLSLAIIGGGVAGVIALAYARRAGLKALILESQSRIGGLWRDLPAWQDIQISAADWALGDLPLQGVQQPQILANIEAWVARFGLANEIRLSSPAKSARQSGSGWELSTPGGVVRARHLVAATGAHNAPLVPQITRAASTVLELHSSAVRDPGMLAGRDVLVVGGGASAFDLLDLCFQHRARRVMWAFRSARWFMPTRKPKHIAGSVRGFAKLQASGMTLEELNATIGADLRSRYEKFGLTEIMPTLEFDVRRDQLIPGRSGMLEHFGSIERHRASVDSIKGGQVTLSDGSRVDPDVLLWATGYSVDLSYFESPAIGSIRSLDALAARCGCIFRSLDAANLYFPSVILDGIGSATWSYSLMCRSLMSHIQGTANLDNQAVAGRLNHFDLVNFLAPRDAASFPPDAWRESYRDLALNTPDERPYPIP